MELSNHPFFVATLFQPERACDMLEGYLYEMNEPQEEAETAAEIEWDEPRVRSAAQ